MENRRAFRLLQHLADFVSGEFIIRDIVDRLSIFDDVVGRICSNTSASLIKSEGDTHINGSLEAEDGAKKLITDKNADGPTR